ncbi:MAG: hypothetical protein IT462_16275 [Planctomycetes bacterium]|nr:hypothetical protein [Planctomycetota bacterium]
MNVAAIDVSAARRTSIEQQVEPAFGHIARMTGLADDGELQLTLVGNSTRFAEIARADRISLDAENVLGYAQHAARRVVLNLSAIEERRLSPISVLRHELTHLMFGAKIRADTPLWFEEGVCLWVEAFAMDALIESSNPNLVEPDIPDFATLEKGLRQNHLAGFSYNEARRVLYLAERLYGRNALQKLLQLLSLPDAQFEPAFKTALGISLPEFEKVWQEDRKRGVIERLWMWVGANMWVLVFLFAAVIALIALALRRRRTAKQIEAWEDEDKYYPGDPSWSFSQGDDDERWRGGVHRKRKPDPDNPYLDDDSD